MSTEPDAAGRTPHERLALFLALQRRIADEIAALRGQLQAQKRPRTKHQPPCGSEKSYQWHRRHGEPTDPACRAAHANYERENAARRRIGAS